MSRILVILTDITIKRLSSAIVRINTIVIVDYDTSARSCNTLFHDYYETV